ncbi:FAD-dependent oxidoreductase [Microlunatus ginsengisoli]|uniref:FAD-dependent oxidoreductase n=1 Tax=Microlunatus ginsengisoli TaxID=363863 RepID=UPI0031E25768
MSAVHRRRTVIVGGVAAGMSAATRLRRLDEQREIVVFERGEHVSFANCGLPYHVGGVIADRDDLLLQTPERLHERFALDVRTRHEVLGIDLAARTVTVLDLRTLSVADQPYDELVLATGAAPTRPPIPGVDRALALRSVEDLDAIMARLDHGVRAAVVIGAGFIGLELAENLRLRGIAVSLVELADHVLPPIDVELAALVRDRLVEAGVDVRTSAAVTAVTASSVLTGDGEIPADLVLLAAGVTPESGLAAAAGLELGPRGGIAVDSRQRTSDPHVFAVGDVAVKRDAVDGADTLVPLAQTANRHGRLVADAIVGRDRITARPVLGTAVVGVLGLTVALTGWSEHRLRAAGQPVRVIHTHPLDHAGYYPGASALALKLLVDPETDAILGAQAVGTSGVDKRIDVIATAMRAGLRASELADLELAYAPQYGAAKDPVVMLGMIADNLAGGLIRTVQWHEVASLVAAGVGIVDVRDPAEFAAGSLPGAVNVPLAELRDRHTEITGPVVVACAVGQRGHTATRLIAQLGHDAANLDGGYRTWLAGMSAHPPFRPMEMMEPAARPAP